MHIATINAPDKGEVGGQVTQAHHSITSKYAAILTFPLFGDLFKKPFFVTVCQLTMAGWQYTQGRKTLGEGEQPHRFGYVGECDNRPFSFSCSSSGLATIPWVWPPAV